MRELQISRRLKAVAGFVGKGCVLADVGCDHGYIPIYLLQKEQIPKAIAMDVNEGPLLRAKAHIREWGLENYIETRLSDGVQALKRGEVQSVVIAGMGGGSFGDFGTDFAAPVRNCPFPQVSGTAGIPDRAGGHDRRRGKILSHDESRTWENVLEDRGGICIRRRTSKTEAPCFEAVSEGAAAKGRKAFRKPAEIRNRICKKED